MAQEGANFLIAPISYHEVSRMPQFPFAASLGCQYNLRDYLFNI